MQSEQDFSGEDSLVIIQSMINKVRNRFSEDGHLYLLWGWVVLICSVAQFILEHYVHYAQYYYVWMGCWLTFIYQAIYIIKKRRRKTVSTYTDDIIKYVWLAFLVNMILVGVFVNILHNEYSRVTNAFFLILYAVPIFLCGIILRFRPLVIGGSCCWALSVVSLYIPDEYKILMISAAMIVAWIIPGYLLRARFKKANAD
jgi:uncharacterized membrane protein